MKPEIIFLTIWAIGVIVTWPVMIWYAVNSRRARGEPVMPRPPASARYADTRASGKQKGKWGGASNCLMVVVDDRELWLSPVFPITLFVPYGAFGLEFRKPVALVRAEARKDWTGMNVRLTLTAKGDPVVIDMRVRDPAKLLSALKI